jgi:hypothetical protein
MIQPLRRYHRYTFLTLTVALPAILVAGLALRPAPPPSERISDRITLMMPGGAELRADPRQLWGTAVDEPDPLVYWAAGVPASLLGARFMGSLEQARERGLAVPQATGYLVLYSPAHSEIVASAPVPKGVK